jgi:fucose 4-O-acetylase-like acetyltransferase
VRIGWVDYLKGFAIIFVVIGHSYRSIGMDIPLVFSGFDEWIYGFHMPLFFLASGFFFNYSKTLHDGMVTLLNKLETVMYPAILWMLIQYFIHYYLNVVLDIDFQSLGLLLIKPYAQFWFVYILFVCFIFSVIISTVPLTSIRLLLLSICFFVLYLVVGDVPVIGTLLYSFSFFLLGRVVFLSSKYLESFSTFSWFMLFFFGMLINSYLYYTPGKAWSAYAGCLLVLSMSFLFFRFSLFPIIRILGINTMYIYLLHIIIRDLTPSFLGGYLDYILIISLGLYLPVVIGSRVLPSYFFGLPISMRLSEFLKRNKIKLKGRE